MSKTAKDNNITFTVQGEWFPENLLGSELTKPGETPLDTEMRLFCSCTRWAFNRLLEGKTRKELKKQAQSIFNINSRFCDDAILQAQAIITSQKELLTIETKETEQKLAKTKNKLSKVEKDLTKATKNKDLDNVEKYKLIVNGRKQCLEKLTAKLAELQAHIKNNTIPKVIFGGRALWEKLVKGKASKEEWRNARQNRLYARGDKTKQGNPNLRIEYVDEEFSPFRVGAFTLSAGISHLAKPGKQAPRIQGKLWIPEKHAFKIWELLIKGTAYSVELIKGKNNRYRAHITFEIETPDIVTNKRNGYLGIDTNPDGIAIANVNYNGQPEHWPKNFTVPYPKALHKFDGEFQVKTHPNGYLYIKIPELSYSRGNRRTYLIGVLAKVTVAIAKELGKPIALEHLKFGKGRLETNKKFNRMASNFPYEKITAAIIRRAHREGVETKPVWPAHTSTIGCWKYMQKHGVTIHHAAAYAIARRATGFKERITKELKEKIINIKYSLPREGKGMPVKLTQFFKRLDKKLLIHNKLIRYEQEKFHTIWSDLRKLYYLKRAFLV